MNDKPTAAEPFNGLTPEQDECLTVLSEECAELIVAIAKVQRHGLLSYDPRNGQQNYVTLQREMGDVLAAARLAETYTLLDWGRVLKARNHKLIELPEWLHHAKVAHE